MAKISSYGEDTTAGPNDVLIVVDSISGTTKKMKLSTLAQLFALLAPGSSQTLSSTIIPKRVVSVATSASPTPNCDITDEYVVTALATGATFGAPTGTPVDGQNLVIRVKDNGSVQSLSFNAIYRAIGVTLPTATTGGQTIYLGMIYNAAATKWDVLAVGRT